MERPTTQPNDSLLHTEAPEAASAPLNDLHLTDAELDGIKGGPTFGVQILLLANGSTSAPSHN